jgi:hypothetical protein
MLSWKDFQGTPELDSPFAASITMIIDVTAEPETVSTPNVLGSKYCCALTKSKNVKITRKMDRASSWVKPSYESNELLNHELGHVLITKKIGEELKKVVEALTGASCEEDASVATSTSLARWTEKFDKEKRSYITSPFSRHQQAQRQYDNETDHGAKSNEQDRWDANLHGDGPLIYNWN